VREGKKGGIRCEDGEFAAMEEVLRQNRLDELDRHKRDLKVMQQHAESQSQPYTASCPQHFDWRCGSDRRKWHGLDSTVCRLPKMLPAAGNLAR